jgi:hypothetical protein
VIKFVLCYFRLIFHRSLGIASERIRATTDYFVLSFFIHGQLQKPQQHDVSFSTSSGAENT